jgi:hypothetical protein
VSAFGTPGSDKLTLDSVFDFGVAVLLQNLPSTEPDGKKDFLDCKNVLKSVAYISPKDGDTAVHCHKLKTGQYP